MDTKLIVELIGYLGSTLVVVSMLMASVVRLRVVNTVGSVIFMCYALIIGSYPTAVMNLFLVGINVWHLIRLFRDRREYDSVDADLKESYIAYFLEKQLDDIRRWFPDFSPQNPDADVVILTSCGGNPAGLFIGKRTAPEEAEIYLDYATPVYRDTTVGRFLYGELKKRGFRTLVFRGSAPKHVPYMEKVGYRKENGAYVLDLETFDPS